MKRTSSPMTLDAMRAFAVQQLAHYTELVAVLDKIKVDPLSVLPQAARRAKPTRRPARRATPKRQPQAARPPAGGSAAQAYAKAAIAKLGVATTKEITAWALKKGWGTISKTPDVVMHQELTKLLKTKVLRRVKHAGRQVRYALATPTKANAAKLASAQAMLNATPAPGAVSEAVN
jgi:hypothetical protein